MSAEDKRALARRFREELWNSGRLSVADEILSPDCDFHAKIPLVTDFGTGPEAVKQLVLFYFSAFSEVEMKVETVVTEGDLVAARWVGSGRHTGDLLGIPPTNRVTRTEGIDMFRIEKGRIVEGWITWDTLGLLRQIGALTLPPVLDELFP